MTNLSGMFSGCTNLASIDLSSFDTSKVTDMSWMFQAASSLSSVNVSSFKTSLVTTMDAMFGDCTSLTTVDISSFDTSSLTDTGFMFSDDSNLHTMKIGEKFTVPSSSTAFIMAMFSTPTKTASGKTSTGNWGLGSETAETSYSASDLATYGKTAGVMAGTWYAQAESKAKITFTAENGDDYSGAITGSMDDQTISVSGTLNPVAYTVASPYKLTFYGWTTGKISWSKGTINGKFYKDQATYNASDGDVTLHAFYIPDDRNMNIRILDMNGEPVSGVTVRYWCQDGGDYRGSPHNARGLVTTGDNGYTPTFMYRLVEIDGLYGADASWGNKFPIATGGYVYQITAVPSGYAYYADTVTDAAGGYTVLTGDSELTTPSGNYTLAKKPTISSNDDGSYTVTLYVAKQSTITFDANGGAGTMASQTLTADGAINPATFTRSGYYFTGWNTKSDGSGTAYSDGATFTPTGSDVTLYAQWTAGAELPEAGYPGDPTSKILGMCFALFGLILIAAFRDRDEK